MLNGGVWAIEEAAETALRLYQKPVILFMLGAVDVGKTHTVATLANRFYKRGLRVAVVDADIGQSDIGPPCCIGLGILKGAIHNLSEVPLHSIYFVGDTSPSSYMRECVTGAATAVQDAKRCKADVILVDSTGWIEGQEAVRFKLVEIEAVDPVLVIAIEQADELAPILPQLNRKVITLRASREARRRSREERRALREAAYRSYFRAARERVFDLSLLAWPSDEGTLVGLFGSTDTDTGGGKDTETLGLGIVKKVDYEQGKVLVVTPVATKDTAINGIKPGVVKLLWVEGRLKEFKWGNRQEAVNP